MERKPATTPNLPARFSTYRVQPVVETTAPDGFERSYQTFPSLAEAEAEMQSFERKPVIDGAEGQQLLWSLYGVRDGQVEHIADRCSEVEALALLYAMTGIRGVSGQTEYPIPAWWIVVYKYKQRFQTIAWLISHPTEPIESDILRSLEIDFVRDEEDLTVIPVKNIRELESE